ncbi:MAG: YraN family protein [Synergistaceae bacterium]|nr:YraN family protein [Synergistaceae bacterium]
MNHLEFGASGEDIAASYLSRMGWRILGRNVRVGRGELDIIATDGGELVIVEVRTRRIGAISPSETTVGPKKIKNLIKTARRYVNSISYNGNWRIDVAAVTVTSSGEWRVEIFEDVTRGMEGGYMG